MIRHFVRAALALGLLGGTLPPASPAVRILTDAPVAPKVPNAAKLTLDIAQGAEVGIGSTVFFRLTTAQPGYLILVDVAQDGKLVQIYPNMRSMAMPVGATRDTNKLQPGRTVSLPDPANPLAAFEFVVEPPAGRGLIVALLSSEPVQMVDLPDIPFERIAAGSALDFVAESAAQLRLPAATTGALVAPQWSFAGMYYQIH